jgi:gliding motility-associated-like protein
MKLSYIIACGLAITTLPAAAVNISLNGSSRQIIALDAEKATGLNKIYVVWNTAELSDMTITGATGALTVQRFSNLGGGYAEDVTTVSTGNGYAVNSPAGDMGYIITDGTTPTYIWIVNYADKIFSISHVEAASEQECENTQLEISGKGSAIHYYSIDGRQYELSREIKAQYYTMEWDEEQNDYVQVYNTSTSEHLNEIMTFTPPFYCNTQVTVSGDRFLEQWGIPNSAISSAVIANGIACYTEAEQTNESEVDEEEGSNLISSNDTSDGLGGSAPADITFRAYTTDAVIHHEWQMASDESFENITHRYNNQELDYTFNEEGTYYVRYVGSNSDGSCETNGDTYTVSIGSSELRIPNAFSPNGDGVNDVWKVGYRSLLNFRCWIFDRYGNQIYEFSDPSQGWDGKYKGKYVKSGVYYYVIEAKGSDGKKYKKGGDINIIDYKLTGSGSSSTGTATE